VLRLEPLLPLLLLLLLLPSPFRCVVGSVGMWSPWPFVVVVVVVVVVDVDVVVVVVDVVVVVMVELAVPGSDPNLKSTTNHVIC
jgi:hypothetical protein